MTLTLTHTPPRPSEPAQTQALSCQAHLNFLQAALWAVQCALWHAREQYRATWHLLQFCILSSSSEGPPRFWHLRRNSRNGQDQTKPLRSEHHPGLTLTRLRKGHMSIS